MPDAQTMGILRRQADESDETRDASVAALLALLEAKRAEAFVRLSSIAGDPLTPWSPRQLTEARTFLRRWVDGVIRDLDPQARVAARKARDLGVDHTLRIFRRFERRHQDVLDRIAYELSLYAVQPDEGEDEDTLFVPMWLLLTGVTYDITRTLERSARQGVPAAVAIGDALGDDRSAWTRRRGIVQTEIDRVLVDAETAAQERATRRGAESLPGGSPGGSSGGSPTGPPEASTDPVLRQIVEVRDTRNHPISRVIDRQVRPVGEPFRASVADVDAMASAMGRPRTGSIYWPQVGSEYVGRSLPAHPYERGRIVPWRASWPGASTAPP